MAHVTLLTIPASAFIPDGGAQLVGGDVAATIFSPVYRPALTFDDTAEEAAVSPEYAMPGQYAGGTLKATLFLAMASADANGVVFDVFIEAVTPDTDALDMEANASWDAANSGTGSCPGTPGNLFALTITLTNKDGVAASDLVRVGVRRDTDSASDDAAGDAYLFDLEIWEET